MKQMIFILFLGSFYSCGLTNTYFFEYNEIVHYKYSNGPSLESISDNKSSGLIDSLRYEALLGHAPYSIKDSFLINLLDSLGYRSTEISSSKFSNINKIFKEKIVIGHTSTSCIYVYRDILVFKKNGKTVGLAKVCFECRAHIIRGSDADTDNFGQNGDYQNLKKILYSTF